VRQVVCGESAGLLGVVLNLQIQNLWIVLLGRSRLIQDIACWLAHWLLLLGNDLTSWGGLLGTEDFTGLRFVHLFEVDCSSASFTHNFLDAALAWGWRLRSVGSALLQRRNMVRCDKRHTWTIVWSYRRLLLHNCERTGARSVNALPRWTWLFLTIDGCQPLLR